MANQKFDIVVTAQDRTAAALGKINDNFAKLGKGTAAESASLRLKEITERVSSFRAIGLQIGAIGELAAGASGGIESAGIAAEGFAGTLGVVGTAGLGAVGAVLGLGAAATKFEQEYSRLGMTIGLTSRAIGISSDELQAHQLAGERVGISAEAMSGAMQNLGKAIEDAAYGRNQAAYQEMTKFGITLHRTAQGGVDVARAMRELGNAWQRLNPQARQEEAAIFGVQGAYNFLMLTEAEREKLLKEAYASGAIRSKEQLADDLRVQQSFMRLGNTWDAVLNALSKKIVIPWLQPLLDGLNQITNNGFLDKVIEFDSKLVNAYAGFDIQPFKKNSSGANAKSSLPEGNIGALSELPAGVRAVLHSESGFNPYAFNPAGGGRGAWGIAQWRGGRLDDFRRVMGHDIWQRKGDAAKDLADQMAFLKWEMMNTHPEARAAFAPGLSNRETMDRWLRGFEGVGPSGVGARDYENDMRRGAEWLARTAAAPASGGSAPTQHAVTVDINMKNAPSGTTVSAATSGPNVVTRTTVQTSLPGGSL